MGRVRRGWSLGLVALVGAVVLVACGGGGSGSGGRAEHPGRVVLDAVGSPGSRPDLERAASIVERRLHKLGVNDASVVVKGRTLVATGTGIATPAATVTQPGLLQVRPVEALVPPDDAVVPPGDERPGPDEFPAGTDVLPTRADAAQVRYAVGPSVMSGDDVSRAEAEFVGGAQGWVVTMSMKPSGVRKLNDLAGRLYSRPPPRNSVALVLDGVVLSVPVFVESSFEGDVQISGDFTEAGAKQLAAALQFGALPVHLRVGETTGS